MTPGPGGGPGSTSTQTMNPMLEQLEGEAVVGGEVFDLRGLQGIERIVELAKGGKQVSIKFKHFL